MQNSLVHQLDEMAVSKIFMNRSFITTSIDNSYDTKKCKIYNLPNYRRQDLSSKLDFIVIFQGIQIERLSLEVQALRIRIKDYQRQIFNSNSYQIQIRQLSQKCFSFEQQRLQYKEQIQKLDNICRTLYNELEIIKQRYASIDVSLKQKYKLEQNRNQQLIQQIHKWKLKFSTLQKNKNKQIQEVRVLMEVQRKKALNLQISKYQLQTQNIKKQNKKLIDIINNKNNQIMNFQNINQELKIANYNWEKYQQQNNEYENKIALISQQIVRLNQRLKVKQQQIEKLKRDLIKSNKTISQNEDINLNYQQLSNKYQQLYNKYDNIQKDSQKISQQNRIYQIQIQKANESDTLLDQYGQQIQKLNHLLQDKISFIQQSKVQYTALKSKNQQILNKLSNYQEQLSLLLNYKRKYHDMQSQILNINKILNQKLLQIKQLKQYFIKIDNQLMKYKQIEKRINQYIIYMEKLVLELNKSKQTIQILENKVFQTQNNIFNIKKQNNNIFQENRNLNQQIIKKNLLYQQIKRSLNQKENFIKNIKYKQQQYNSIKINLQKLSTSYQTLEGKYKIEQNKNNELNEQNKLLTKQLKNAKKQGIINPQFIKQFQMIRLNCEKNNQELRKIQMRYQTINKILAMLKQVLIKQFVNTKSNNQQLYNIKASLSIFSEFIKKYINLQIERTNAIEQNIQLQSKSRLMNFQIQNLPIRSSFIEQTNNQLGSKIFDKELNKNNNSRNLRVYQLKNY